MIGTITLLSLVGAGFFTKWAISDKTDIKCKFNNVAKGNRELINLQGDFFSVRNIELSEYVAELQVVAPAGLSADILEKHKGAFEAAFGGMVEIERKKFDKYITMKIIRKSNKRLDFVPIQPSKKSEIYIANKLCGNPYFLDLNKDPHILICGATGTGKTRILAEMLTNIIYWNPEDYEIYLTQLCKSELGAFSDCPGVVKTSYRMKEIISICKELADELDKRDQLFNRYNILDFEQWNENFSTCQLKRKVLVIEEMSFFEECEAVWTPLLKIMKGGRSLGIHVISTLQRTVATELNPTIKSQMTKISFKQKSKLDSENAIDSKAAFYLEQQEAIISGNKEVVTVAVPTVDKNYQLLNKYVPEVRMVVRPSDNDFKPYKNAEVLVVEEDSKKLLREATKVIDVDFREERKSVKTSNHKFKSGVI